ncbi:MAG TPA: hypothetical protein DIC30_10900 [Oceanospirillales bacterium]|jgi:uncharacterized protein YcgL (UPF0745 family)|nr:hypothetical protein [Oleispira sp.]HCM06507.1 hypothetical protein [Oceanospirillales bacterium]|tara:strand:- start:2437 stop:2730 length:294 start_codon:yes stop_codon:yes gene_type:complete
MTKLLCNIYKSRRKEETYLYVSLKDDLSRVPEVLLETFGRPELVTKLIITEDRKLARAEAEKVLAAIEEKGFYLQLPPPKEELGLGLDVFCKRDDTE